MDLYIVRNEWDHEGYTFHEDLFYTTDFASARADLEQRVKELFGAEIPDDHSSWQNGNECFYIQSERLDFHG